MSEAREAYSSSREACGAYASDLETNDPETTGAVRPFGDASYLSSSPHLSTYECWLRTYVSQLIEKIWASDHPEPTDKFINL